MAKVFMCEDDDSRILMVTHYYFSTRHEHREGTDEQRIKRGLGCLEVMASVYIGVYGDGKWLGSRPGW